MNGRSIPGEKFNQLRAYFFTSALAKRQRPATEEEETYLEQTFEHLEEE
jgi:hypothetical protein